MSVFSVAPSDRPDVGTGIELRKWEAYYERFGYDLIRVRGNTVHSPGNKLVVIDELTRRHPDNISMMGDVFAARTPRDFARIDGEIERRAEVLHSRLSSLIAEWAPEFIHVDTLLSYPACLPFSLAALRIVDDLAVPIVGRDHDFVWERTLIEVPYLAKLCAEQLPPIHSKLLHVALTQTARDTLEQRLPGINSAYVPNFFDFEGRREDHDPDGFRAALRIPPTALLLFQPTRCAPPKGVHHALHLAHGIQRRTGRETVVVVSGPNAGGLGKSIGSSSISYRDELTELSRRLGVPALFLNGALSLTRDERPRDGFCVGDGYYAADLVTFPSMFEGFGNPVVESIAAEKPLFTAAYDVMKSEFLPAGFRFALMEPDAPETFKETWTFNVFEDRIPSIVLDEVIELLPDGSMRKEYTQGNLALARDLYADTTENVRNHLNPIVNWATSRRFNNLLPGGSSP